MKFALRGAALLAALVVSTPATSVFAADPPANGKDSDERAKELFLQGDRAYSEGRYETARDSFQEAYKLSGRPQLLYNLANTYERLGKLTEAADALQKYLDTAKPKDRQTIERRLKSMNERLETQKKEQEREREERERKERERRAKEEAERQANPPKESDKPPPPAKVEGPSPSPVPWILVGTGGALAAAGATFGILALGARSDAKAGCKDSPRGLICTDGAESALGRDTAFSIIADVGIGLGVVGIATGVILLVTRGKPAEPAASLPVRVVAHKNGAEVGFGMRF